VYSFEPTEAGVVLHPFDEISRGCAEAAGGIGLPRGAFGGMKARAVATQHYDLQTGAVDYSHRNLEAHLLALLHRGVGDRLRIAKGIFFSLTRLCAYAADDSATETAIPPRIFNVNDIRHPCLFVASYSIRASGSYRDAVTIAIMVTTAAINGRTLWFSITFWHPRLFRLSALSQFSPKVFGTKMFWQTNGFGRDSKKPTFPSSSPLSAGMQSVSAVCRDMA
jgi:hypothetical protein